MRIDSILPKYKSIIRVCFLLWMALLFILSQASAGPIITAKDLLKSNVFPEASFGMAVNLVRDFKYDARAETTAGEFKLSKTMDTIECWQSIPTKRLLAVVRFPMGTLAKIKMIPKTSGSFILTGDGTTVRINGDSILMIAPGKSGDIQAQIRFLPDAHFECSGNHNFFDGYGGVSFFEHGNCPDSKLQASITPRRINVTWPNWKAGDVFWISLSPPKPYDWESSLKDRVVMYGSSFKPYPTDEEIKGMSKYGNILWNMSDRMLWKSWQMDLTPRDLGEWRRMIDTAHKNGMKVMPYTTPLYFLKGTPKENQAILDYSLDGGKCGSVPSWGIPDNQDIYMEQLTRVVKEYGADGLYFDGMYFAPEYLAASYYLARYARDLVGDKGILQYHASVDSPSLGGLGTRTFCPGLNAYYNFLLRGEGEESVMDPAYMRYFLGTYNTSNSIALLCNNGAQGIVPTEKHFEAYIQNNIRIPLGGELIRPELLEKHYWPRLTPDLQKEIEPNLPNRTGAFEAQLKRANDLTSRREREKSSASTLKASDYILPKADFRGGYWRFEEPYGDTLYNSIGINDPKGTAAGGIFHSETTFGSNVPALGLANKQSMEFDGVSGARLVAGSGSDLNVGTGDFTLEAWIYPRNANNRPVVVGKNLSGVSRPEDTGYVIYLQPKYSIPGVPTYTINFIVADRDGGAGEVDGSFRISSEELKFNEWHHVAGVRSGKEIRLYIDGKLAASTAISGKADYSSDQLFTIGCGRQGGADSFQRIFDGYIDEVRLTVEKALSPPEFLNALKGDVLN